jgi:hypothetical protein
MPAIAIGTVNPAYQKSEIIACQVGVAISHSITACRVDQGFWNLVFLLLYFIQNSCVQIKVGPLCNALQATLVRRSTPT